MPRTPDNATASATLSTVIELKPAPRSIADAARLVLIEAKRPLHIKKIVEGIQRLGVGREQDPARLRGSVTPTLLRRKDWFARCGKGLYGLVVQNVEE